MIALGLLLCLLHIIAVTAQDSACSISIFTRETCMLNVRFTDAEACTEAGCCFDATSGIPATGRCYKKSSTGMFDTFDFQPTNAPEGGADIKTVGGEPGFPGSELILECNPSTAKPCKSSGVYQGERSDCVRQGCCWRFGRCYQQTWKILRLRSKCPPGFEDPPACHVINPCDDSPCLNGGKCIFTGPAEFKCECLPGFAGVICDNCKKEQLPISRGKLVPDKAEYTEAEFVQLECDANHAPQDGAVASRQCRDSDFTPPWSTHPFTCREKCEVTKVDNAESNRDVASGAVVSIKHGEDVTYACKSTFTSAAGTKLTRTCEDGKLTPALDVETIVCNADCVITAPAHSSTPTATPSVHHGEDVQFNCLDTHKGSVVVTTTRKCDDGVFKPEFSSDPFTCTENCKAVAPTDGSVKGGNADLKHTEGVEIECAADHVLEGIASGSCLEGTITPAVTAVCKKPCDLIAIDGATSYPSSGKVLHLTTVVYTCNAHFKTPTSGDTFSSQCVDGAYTTPLQTCHQQCQIPQIGNGYSVPAALVYIDNGASVEFSCDSEHSTPLTTSYTCDLGTLDPALNLGVDFCHPDCKLPHILRSVITAPARITYGSVITLGCEPGYTLITAYPERKCESGGELHFTLDQAPVECKPKLRSCKDVLEKSSTGMVNDGFYDIQPSDSLLPFKVKCTFIGDTAITEVGHDTEAETAVQTCNGPMCYKKSITYQATIPQIRALIDHLGTCRQYVEYDCHNSRMFGSTMYSGWDNWQGTKRFYWGGSGGQHGYCSCGTDDSCDESGEKCNCNSNDDVWRQDSGYLEQQIDLPVTAVYFGDVDSSGEFGRHTVGRLECTEGARRIKSCKDVPEVNGINRNGVYQIQPSDSVTPFKVQCYFNSFSGLALTVIGHDSEALTDVGTCNGAQCYKKTITYEATIPQIRALIDYLGSCKQYLKYDCYGSRLFGTSTMYAGWENWEGTLRHYWGGSGGIEQQCRCGNRGDCDNTSYKCNCNINDKVWRSDYGYIEQQHDLPVTALYFGDVDSSSEMGKHHLYPLECLEY